MEKMEARRQFADELLRRYEEMQQWAIGNWPDPDHPLSTADFAAARKEILALGAMTSDINRQEPEPSDGGAQYVDVAPTPWP